MVLVMWSSFCSVCFRPQALFLLLFLSVAQHQFRPASSVSAPLWNLVLVFTVWIKQQLLIYGLESRDERPCTLHTVEVFNLSLLKFLLKVCAKENEWTETPSCFRSFIMDSCDVMRCHVCDWLNSSFAPSLISFTLLSVQRWSVFSLSGHGHSSCHWTTSTKETEQTNHWRTVRVFLSSLSLWFPLCGTSLLHYDLSQ